MSRYRSYSQGDDRPDPMGDAAFIGVDESISRDQLAPGFCARAINKRMREGDATPRRGAIMPAAANGPVYAAMVGSSVYSNPNEEENLLVATASGAWRFRDSGTPMPIASVQPFDTPTEFVQAFDKVIAMRGKDRPELVWNGVSATGFELPPAPSNSTKDTIAPAETAEVFKNRLLVPVDRDNVQVSDILDYTQYDPILENWRINKGSADRLVRIFPYNNIGVVMFKEGSILLLRGFEDQDHPETASLNPINDKLGLGGRRTVIQDGADCLFLSPGSRQHPGGIYRLTQVDQNTVGTVSKAVSEPIRLTVSRINWRARATFTSALLGEYCYWAVALDESPTPNAMLVYNSASGKWETSSDEYQGGLVISALHVMNFRGTKRLYAIDYVSRTVYVLYEGQTDLLASGEFQILDLMETRGYTDTSPDPELLNFRRAKVYFSTWDPRVKITAVTDGANEELVLRDGITKDRRRYYPFGVPDFDEANLANDHGAPRRQDYSVTGEVDFEDGADGVDPDLLQDSVEAMTIERTGRWLSLRIENMNGQCDVLGVKVEAIPTGRELRTAA